MNRGVRQWIRAGEGYPFACLTVLAAAALLLPLRPLLRPPTIMLAFVPVIIVLARLLGPWPSAVGAVVAFLALDFLFLPPYYRLVVGSLPEWIGLIVFLVVALAAGQQTGRLRRREDDAVRRFKELELLNRLSFRIASARSPAEVAAFVVDRVSAVLGAERVALYVAQPGVGAARCLASAGRQTPSSGEEAFVQWVTQQCKAIGLPAADVVPGGAPVSVEPGEALPGMTAQGVFVPLKTADSIEGVLHAVLPESAPEGVDPSLLVAVANLAAASFERRRLEEQAAHVAALQEADRLKTTLVSSVSHELKTPLAAATARVTGLIDEALVPPARLDEELTAVADDLQRLNVSIGDLLDLSRLESDAWRPQRELYEVGEVLGTVASRLPEAQRDRLHFTLSDPAQAVCADFAQLARALFNLVENALAYSPPGEAVVVTSAVKGGEVLVTVEDRGPGVGDTEKSLVFEKFYRGGASSRAPGGTGLGLPIAREIVRSHGGRLYVEDAEPRGARFIVALPIDACTDEGGGERGIA